MVELIIKCMFLGVIWSWLGVLPGIVISRNLHGKAEPPLYIVACLACAGPIGGLMALYAWVQQRGWQKNE